MHALHTKDSQRRGDSKKNVDRASVEMIMQRSARKYAPNPNSVSAIIQVNDMRLLGTAAEAYALVVKSVSLGWKPPSAAFSQVQASMEYVRITLSTIIVI